MIENIIYIASYLIGSIPFGYFISVYVSGKDIRTLGSGNIGATNIARIHGKKLGILTLFLDGLKAIIALKIATLFEASLYIAAICCILGHIFPIWLKFKGGKGVATIIGSILFIEPLLGVIFMVSWLIIFGLKRVASLSSIVSTLILLIISLLTGYDKSLIYFMVIISLIVIFTHRENIYRMIRGNELNFR